MPANMDDALSALRALVGRWDEYLREPFSEADTRVKFIDPILTQVLGWAEFPQIDREERYIDPKLQEQRCIDYTVKLNEPILIVEAKRLLKDFEIPDINQVKFKLDGVLQGWKNAWSAVQQARGYCDEKQAKYALVTNGRQFIAFQAITERPGGWKKGTAIVWRSPQDLIDRFTDFYMSLSRDTIAQGQLAKIAGELQDGPLRHRPRAFLTGVSGGGYRNDLYDMVQRYFGEALLDLRDPSDEFLERCYCTSDNIIKYGKQLDSLIVDELPTFRTPVQPVKAGHKKDAFDRQVIAVAQTRPGKPLNVPLIVVMGGGGVGKTTFLQWYFRTHLKANTKEKKELLEKLVLLECDYRTIEGEVGEIRARTLAMLVEQLAETTRQQTGSYEQMKEIFREQIAAAVEGELKPWASEPAELEKRISDLLVRLRQDHLLTLRLTVNYLRSRAGKHTIFVLDNIDQKDEPLQIKLFQIAQELVSATKTVVVFVMRESTYLNLMHSPQLNAFVTLDFHVKVQPAAVVLEKRLAYVSDQLGGDDDSVASTQKWDVTVGNVRRFLQLIKRTVAPETGNAEIIRCVEAVSTTHTRGQLKTIYDFLVSGHTKIGAYLQSNQPSIPFHEFLTSIMLEDRRLFAERESDRFINVFGLSSHSNASHFTVLRLLAYFRSLGQEGECSPGDFVAVPDVFEQFEDQGISQPALFEDIKRMAKFGLLMTESQNTDKAKEEDTFAVTRAGLYYLDTLYHQFAYFSTTMIDTMMADMQAAQLIAGLLKGQFIYSKVPIKVRLSAAETFLDYLGEREDSELTRGVVAAHPVFGSYRFVPTMRQGVAKVKASLQFATQRSADPY